MGARGFLLSRIFGIEIRASRSWLVILFLVTLLLATQYEQTNAAWGTATAYVAGIVTSVLFFGSVIVHELAHCVVARRFGIQARAISLNFLGGLSWLSRQTVRPLEEFSVSIAGPVANLVLGVIFLVGGFLMSGLFEVAAAVSIRLGYINALLAGFNVLPGFPLDGGRVLRSIVWWVTGSYEKGTNLAAMAGQGIAGFLMMVGFASTLATGFGGLWLVIVGYYLYVRARDSRGEVALRRAMAGLTLGNMWLDTLPPIERSTTVSQFVEQMVPGSTTQTDTHYMVVDDGVIWGVLPVARMLQVDTRLWDSIRAGDVMHPIGRIEKLSLETDIMRALEAIYASDLDKLPVVEENVVQGFVGRDSLLRFVASRMASERG